MLGSSLVGATPEPLGTGPLGTGPLGAHDA